MIKNPNQESTHTGSPFDSSLEEEGIRSQVQGAAIKRVLAWQFAQRCRSRRRQSLAWQGSWRRADHSWIGSSSPNNTAVSLETLTRAANVLGKRLVFEIRDGPVGDKATYEEFKHRSASKVP